MATAAGSTVWTHLPASTSLPPAEVPAVSLAEGLGHVARHLRGSSKVVRDRIDLAELAEPVAGAWRGEIFTQTLLIPDSLLEELAHLHGVRPLVLLPPRAGGACIAVRGSQSSTTDAIVMLMDAFGAVKGLAPNKRARMLCAACGLDTEEPAGDVFLGRINQSAGGSLILGCSAPPGLIVAREWLEAAQAAHKSGEHDLDAAGMAVQIQEQVLAIQKFAAFAAAGDMEGAGAAAAGQVRPSPSPSPAAAAAAEGGGGDGADVVVGERELGKLDWQDQPGEVTVNIPVPAHTKAAHVKCEIGTESLRIEVSTLAEGSQLVVEGVLFQAVNAEDCEWYLEGDGDKRTLTLELEKARAMRWLVLTR